MAKSEHIDLVDSSGKVVRANIPRDDAAHYDGLHMQVVIAVVRNKNGEFLVHQRALSKKVNPGDMDHVCGAMIAGENPETAAAREALEEGGVHITNAKIVHAGVNEYGRWRYLLAAVTDDEPDASLIDPTEVAHVGFYSLEALHQKQASGEFTFVDGFFDDIALAKAV